MTQELTLTPDKPSFPDLDDWFQEPVTEGYSESPKVETAEMLGYLLDMITRHIAENHGNGQIGGAYSPRALHTRFNSPKDITISENTNSHNGGYHIVCKTPWNYAQICHVVLTPEVQYHFSRQGDNFTLWRDTPARNSSVSVIEIHPGN